MNKWLLAALALILGILAGGMAVSRITGKTGTEELEQIQNLESQMTALRKERGEMQRQNDQLQKDGDALRKQVTETQQERESCLSRFNRKTILYDGTVFENRRWVIPADVEPVLLGAIGRASYTHFDPRTQTETIKMQPHSQ